MAFFSNIKFKEKFNRQSCVVLLLVELINLKKLKFTFNLIIRYSLYTKYTVHCKQNNGCNYKRGSFVFHTNTGIPSCLILWGLLKINRLLININTYKIISNYCILVS